jgi:hypothetical protein
MDTPSSPTIHYPHTANRHDADSRGAGADRLLSSLVGIRRPSRYTAVMVLSQPGGNLFSVGR